MILFVQHHSRLIASPKGYKVVNMFGQRILVTLHKNPRISGLTRNALWRPDDLADFRCALPVSIRPDRDLDQRIRQQPIRIRIADAIAAGEDRLSVYIDEIGEADLVEDSTIAGVIDWLPGDVEVAPGTDDRYTLRIDRIGVNYQTWSLRVNRWYRSF